MTLLSNRKFLTGLLLVVVVAVACLTWVGYVQAQPSSVSTQSTATATTTVAYLTAGVATSTYQFDNPVFSSGKITNMSTVDAGTLYVQHTASTSAAQLGIKFQCSNNNVDWYDSEATTTARGGAYASTTLFTVPIASCVTFHERVQFFAPTGSVPSAVYAEVDLKKNPSTP